MLVNSYCHSVVIQWSFSCNLLSFLIFLAGESFSLPIKENKVSLRVNIYYLKGLFKLGSEKLNTAAVTEFTSNKFLEKSILIKIMINLLSGKDSFVGKSPFK